MANVHARADMATLSAVADFVVNLSIAERSLLIYGADHPLVRGMAAKVVARLQRALDLQSPVAIRFTREAVFCGDHCLERSHPIYRRLAERMWSLGIATVTFSREVDAAELERFVLMLNRAVVEQRQQVDVTRLLADAELRAIRVDLLRDLVSFTDEEEVAAVSERERERFWDDFMRRLAGLGELLPDGTVLGSDEPGEQVANDYATAVIDYMKEMQRLEQQRRMLAETDVGHRLRELLDNLGPDLQRQILASVITSPKASPEVLQRLIQDTAPENLIGALERVNAAGRRMPATAFRTLSLLCTRLGRSPVQLDRPEGSEPLLPPDVEGLLDSLLLEDDRPLDYMTPDYEAAIEAIERTAARTIDRRAPSEKRLDLSFVSGEQHFLWVAQELLPGGDRSERLALAHEAERSLLELLEADAVECCHLAMEVARAGRAAADAHERHAFVWETERVLAPLAARLAGGSRADAGVTMALLSAIGEPAIESLISTLQSSSSLAARRRALELLEEMGPEVVPHVLQLLEEEQPWYVRRNAVLLLRRRRERAGAAAARRLWPSEGAKVRAEIARYLFAIDDEDAPALLRSCLETCETGVVLAVVRQALRSDNPTAVRVVLEHLETLLPHQAGTARHLALLEALSGSPDPAAQSYLASSPWTRLGTLPWRRRLLRRLTDELGGEAH